MILSSTLPDGTFQIHLTRKGAPPCIWLDPDKYRSTRVQLHSGSVKGCHWRQNETEGATWSWPEVVLHLSSPLLGCLRWPGGGFCHWVGCWSCFSGETDFNCWLENIECLDVDFAFWRRPNIRIPKSFPQVRQTLIAAAAANTQWFPYTGPQKSILIRLCWFTPFQNLLSDLLAPMMLLN